MESRMTYEEQILKKLKKRPLYRYGLFNFDRIFTVHWTKADARKEACEWTGEPWKETRKLYQIRKVKITLEEFEGRPR